MSDADWIALGVAAGYVAGLVALCALSWRFGDKLDRLEPEDGP